MKKDRKEMSGSGNKVAYEVIPYKRDQDLVRIGEFIGTGGLKISYASIVDGWSNLEKIAGNEPGRIVAERVSKEFPILFLKALEERKFNLDGVEQLALDVSKEVDAKVLSWYPAHASCVGTFIFELPSKVVIVAEGTISTLLWNGKFWEKPIGIGDYVLDGTKYESAARRFFGRGELKNNPFYSVNPDVVVVSKNVPIFVATDGLIMDKAIMTLGELNEISSDIDKENVSGFIKKLGDFVRRRRDLQKDDISIFLRI